MSKLVTLAVFVTLSLSAFFIAFGFVGEWAEATLKEIEAKPARYTDLPGSFLWDFFYRFFDDSRTSVGGRLIVDILLGLACGPINLWTLTEPYNGGPTIVRFTVIPLLFAAYQLIGISVIVPLVAVYVLWIKQSDAANCTTPTVYPLALTPAIVITAANVFVHVAIALMSEPFSDSFFLFFFVFTIAAPLLVPVFMLAGSTNKPSEVAAYNRTLSGVYSAVGVVLFISYGAVVARAVYLVSMDFVALGGEVIASPTSQFLLVDLIGLHASAVAYVVVVGMLAPHTGEENLQTSFSDLFTNTFLMGPGATIAFALGDQALHAADKLEAKAV